MCFKRGTRGRGFKTWDLSPSSYRLPTSRLRRSRISTSHTTIYLYNIHTHIISPSLIPPPSFAPSLPLIHRALTQTKHACHCILPPCVRKNSFFLFLSHDHLYRTCYILRKLFTSRTLILFFLPLPPSACHYAKRPCVFISYIHVCVGRKIINK